MRNDWRIAVTAILIGVTTLMAYAARPVFKGIAGTGRDPMSVQALPDTLRILAIRVDFPRDTLSTTTGDGGFDFGAREGRKIDPPPHDSLYFQEQMTFVHNYFHQVSDGKLSIQADIYPAGYRSAYRMPEPVWHYHPDPSDNERTNLLLTQLWKTAWDSADADTAVSFYDTLAARNRYDLYVMIHAGAGNEYDLGYDETPFDIPSGFITNSDLRKYLNINDPLGLPVRNGSFHIPRGAILPEMSSQKVGTEWVDIGVGGLYSLLIGHAIGLPFLYDTEEGTSRIGRWSLMDRGFGTFFGILPGYPDAWSRVKMGWSIATPCPDSGLVQIRIPQADTIVAPDVIRIPGAGEEYFLAEARNRDPDSLDYTYVYDSRGRRAKLTNQYEIELDDSIRDSFGVIVRADNYEFDTPGSGILIWRINQAEERRREAMGTPLQTGSAPYVVKLIEADGAEDIGQEYGFFSAGYGTETGSPYDAFFAGNDEWSRANNGNTNVQYDRYRIPRAELTNRAPVPFILHSFSRPGRLMSFQYANEPIIPGERRLRIPPSATPVTMLPFDANFDGREEIWIASGSNIFAVSDSGSWLGTHPVSFVHTDSITAAVVDSMTAYALETTPVSAAAIENVTIGLDAMDVPHLLMMRALPSDSLQHSLEAYRVLHTSNRFAVERIGTRQIAFPYAVPGNLQFDDVDCRWYVNSFNFSLELSLDLDSVFTTALPPANTMRFLNYEHLLQTYPIPSEYRSNPSALNFKPVGVASTFVGINRQLFVKNPIGTWREIPLMNLHSPLHGVAWTTENLAVLDDQNWWLVGKDGVQTDFPRRLPSNSIPVSMVAGANVNDEPILWYGTQSGELYSLNKRTRDDRYPIAIGSLSVDGLVLLSDSSTSTSRKHVVAVSRDGGIYIAPIPNNELSQITWACPNGSASGIPKYYSEQTWSTTFGSGISYSFVWPNPIRDGIGYVRLGISSANASATKVNVYDLDGERVATLTNPYPVEGGGFEYKWNANVERGMYLIRVETPGTPVKLIKAAVIK
ncbi:MAG: hypothetical protein OEM52_10160 [bacterium]|nr:hypothetical protein [bacterium]